ncbi:MAG: hypothetical protein WDZ28_00515 [Simkaniaceae bacterium]
MHRTFKILGGSIGIVILIGLAIYLIANFYPSLFFYNTAYKTHTQLKGYVLTDEQLSQSENIFSKNEQFSPFQLSFDQLNKYKKIFIVILAKNTGGKQAFGTLKCTVGHRSVEVSVIGLRPNMKEFDVWIIPVGSAILGDGSNQPQAFVEWKTLYVK